MPEKVEQFLTAKEREENKCGLLFVDEEELKGDYMLSFSVCF